MAGRMIGEGKQPLICTPLVSKKRESILAELSNVLEKKPDIIEWRADFFEGTANTQEVISIAKHIKEIAGGTPVIFTLRSLREGGQLFLSDVEAIDLNAAICRHTDVEYVDCELSNLPGHIEMLRLIASEHNTKIIASYHNFNLTPAPEILLQKFAEAKKSGADVAKIAVMPNSLNDVLTLLRVTLEVKNTLDIPIITMSMGGYGAITRMVGGVFGSAVTFAVGQSSSAPGQMPIEDVRTVLSIVQKSLGSENA